MDPGPGDVESRPVPNHPRWNYRNWRRDPATGRLSVDVWGPEGTLHATIYDEVGWGDIHHAADRYIEDYVSRVMARVANRKTHAGWHRTTWN